MSDPWLDHDVIYSSEYYEGNGADPWVDYVSEWQKPSTTVRRHEWRGVLKLVESLRPLSCETTWLDYGAGLGGLVRYVKQNRQVGILGYEPGCAPERSRESGSFLSSSDLEQGAWQFDIVTAIEVLEHVVDPLDELSRIRALLKPGGLFFYTTGNAEPHRQSLLSWRYFVPEIHISIYEPRTLALALKRTGFRPEFRGFLPGFTDIIRFKVLKNLHRRQIARWENIVPWSVLTRVIDRRLGISLNPVAWAV